MAVRYLLLALALLAAGNAAAHPLDPSLLELTEIGDGKVEVLWREPASAPRGARLSPILPKTCRQLAPAELNQGGQRISLRWEAKCSEKLEGAELGVAGLAARGTDALLRVHLADGRLVQAVLRGDRETFVIPAKPSAAALLADYLRLGFHHILTGYDHLLFVLGLLFLVRGRRALLLTITAFTLGHSVTLSLAALGWLKLPSAPVEAAIAASIFVLALELAREGKNRGTSPWKMAASFGLLHGVGFAGALAEAGLPQDDVPLALFGFNLGIEIGQLAFVAAILLLMTALDRLPAKWKEAKPSIERLSLPAAYLIGSLSFYWLLERLPIWPGHGA
jgi:hydrogenase/urease accessory protein HupE